MLVELVFGRDLYWTLEDFINISWKITLLAPDFIFLVKFSKETDRGTSESGLAQRISNLSISRELKLRITSNCEQEKLSQC